ncbi:thiopurine S-methyltransferase [Luteimonas sp. RIT-PG2_3]
MEQGFWHQRWETGRIGFHQDRPSPLLDKHWPALALPAGSRVFVPLCGKSLDMAWLAEQGHAVLGIELSELAIRQFFDERGLSPATHASASGVHFVAGPYELICGDAFALPDTVLAGCAGVYDRAALIALPPPMRATYVDTAWHRLRPGCRGLLITLEYPQAQKDGPPFSVEAPEVRERFAADWTVDLLERRDILDREPGFVAEGVTALSTCAWRLDRRD